MVIDPASIWEGAVFLISALGSAVAIVLNDDEPPKNGGSAYLDTSEDPSAAVPGRDSAAALAAQAKKHAPSLSEQLATLPEEQRAQILTKVYEIADDAFGNGNRDAENQLRIMTGYGLRFGLLSGVARQLLTYQYALSQPFTPKTLMNLRSWRKDIWHAFTTGWHM